MFIVDGFKHVKYFNDVMHFINIELIKFGIFGIGLIITIVSSLVSIHVLLIGE